MLSPTTVKEYYLNSHSSHQWDEAGRTSGNTPKKPVVCKSAGFTNKYLSIKIKYFQIFYYYFFSAGLRVFHGLHIGTLSFLISTKIHNGSRLSTISEL